MEELLREIVAFNRERDWEQFHSPKNVVMDLASEVGELVEHFRWLTELESYEANGAEVREEIGDVFRVVIYLAHRLGIDPIEAAREKLELTGKRYPAESCRGRSDKYVRDRTRTYTSCDTKS